MRPLANLCGAHPELLGQLGLGLVFSQSSDGQLRLERGLGVRCADFLNIQTPLRQTAHAPAPCPEFARVPLISFAERLRFHWLSLLQE